LSEPLRDPALYEPCKPRPADHFTIRIAIWNGRAVGIDVTTKPNHPKLAECLKKQVSGLEWKEKVRSLNTVVFSY
jgi:hypothetical protein